MRKRDFKSTKKIIKRASIVLMAILLIFGMLFLNKYYDDKREKEIGNIIKNAMNNTEEESAEELSEENKELIDKFEYSYDENNEFTVGIFKEEKTENISVHAFCHYSEENIGLMQNDFMFIWMYPYTEGFDISATISVGESTYFYLMNDGNLSLNDVPLEPTEDIKEDYLEAFEKMRDELAKFYKENEIANFKNDNKILIGFNRNI